MQLFQKGSIQVIIVLSLKIQYLFFLPRLLKQRELCILPLLDDVEISLNISLCCKIALSSELLNLGETVCLHAKWFDNLDFEKFFFLFFILLFFTTNF